MGDPNKSKLRTNDDQSAVVPLKRRADLVLEEPSADELAQIEEWVSEADKKLPKSSKTQRDINAMDDGPEKDAAQAELTARVEAIYRDRPHVDVLVRICNLLKPEGEEEVTTAHVLGWAVNPRACAMLLDHWNRPTAGPSLLTLAGLGPKDALAAVQLAAAVDD